MEVPEWFVEKYPDYSYLKLNEKSTFAIAQLWESKFYEKLSEDERLKDIQRVLLEVNRDEIVLILLHECGGITRVKITKTEIIGSEPVTWKKVEYVEHNYCYGCSDIQKILHEGNDHGV